MYTGNAVVVNLAMRFPWLIPVAAAVGIAVVAPPPAPPPPTPVVVVAPPPTPVAPPVAKVIPPVEKLCPPPELLTKAELAKLSKKQRNQLKAKGCIKG